MTSDCSLTSANLFVLIGKNEFSVKFRKIIIRHKHIGYNINVMRQSACLVFNQITFDNYASFFKCTPAGRASDSMMAPTKLLIFVDWDRGFMSVAWPTGVQTVFFVLLQILSPRYLHRRAAYRICESSFLIHHGVYLRIEIQILAFTG